MSDEQRLSAWYDSAKTGRKKLHFRHCCIGLCNWLCCGFYCGTQLHKIDRAKGLLWYKVEDAFKLLDSFEGLLDRDLIQNNLEKHFIKLLRQYRQHLKHVQSMFVKSRTTPPIYNNMPPIAGALHWSRGLAERANIAMYKFRLCHKTILESDEMADVEKSHASLMESLQEYERLKCEQWAREVDASVAAKLKQPLLQRRASNDQLVVNFDGALVRLLREVKYFLQLGLEVPDTAMAIYKKAEVFRTQTGNLELIVNKYNWAQVLTTVLQLLISLQRSE